MKKSLVYYKSTTCFKIFIILICIKNLLVSNTKLSTLALVATILKEKKS